MDAGGSVGGTVVSPPLPQAAMLPREAMLAPMERKPLCEAVGRVAADGAFEVEGRIDHSDIRGCNLLVQ